MRESLWGNCSFMGRYHNILISLFISVWDDDLIPVHIYIYIVPTPYAHKGICEDMNLGITECIFSLITSS